MPKTLPPSASICFWHIYRACLTWDSPSLWNLIIRYQPGLGFKIKIRLQTTFKEGLMGAYVKFIYLIELFYLSFQVKPSMNSWLLSFNSSIFEKWFYVPQSKERKSLSRFFRCLHLLKYIHVWELSHLHFFYKRPRYVYSVDKSFTKKANNDSYREFGFDIYIYSILMIINYLKTIYNNKKK